MSIFLKFWVLGIFTFTTAFGVSFFAERDGGFFDSPELEARKVVVKRQRSERDLMMISRWRARTEREQQVAEQLMLAMQEIIGTTDAITPVLYSEMPVRVSQFSEPNFEFFKKYEVDYILDGAVTFSRLEETGYIVVLKLIVWDVSSRAKTFERNFEFFEADLENLSKQAATIVFEHITGRYGFFYGKMLYAAKQRGKAKFKRIVLASNNNDGTVRVENIANGSELVFGPRYCKGRDEVLYVLSKKREGTGIYIYNRSTGGRRKLELGLAGEEDKMIFAGDFSSDCKKIIFSMAENGGTNIYTINRETGELRRLTNTAFIDTSPKFFRNDGKVIFTSDRTGSSRIWVMNADGSGQTMLSHSPGVHFSPEVSRDGKKIIFSKNRAGRFYLSLMNVDGTEEEVLHSSFLIENPRWAPIGRTVVFSMKNEAGASSRIYALSVNSMELQELAGLSGDLTEPFWIDEL